MVNKKPQPIDYESRLKDGTDLWLREGSDFFGGSGTLLAALKNLVANLDQLGIPYAVVGALALGQLGFAHFTVDIDVLTISTGLEKFRSACEALGYRPVYPGARRRFRDMRTGVRIDFIKAGDYPGDSKPKSVRFPDPAEAFFEQNGIRFLRIEKMVELKLASGISAEHRQRDLVDIQELIHETHLPLEFEKQLDPSVRDAYRDLWRKAQIKDPFHD